MNQPSYPLSTNFSPAQLSATIGKVQRRTGMSITEGRGHVDCFALFRYSVGGSSTQRPCEHLEIPAGSTALSVAELKGHKDVVAVLKSSGVRR